MARLITETDADERFQDSLNECYGTVSIAGYEYDPARVLKEVDPIAYLEEFNNWLDSEGLELGDWDEVEAQDSEESEDEPITVEVINQNLKGFRGTAWLLRASNGDFYVASGMHVVYSGWEVLVFPATPTGSIKDWGEVAGGRGISHPDAVADLVRYLNDGE